MAVYPKRESFLPGKQVNRIPNSGNIGQEKDLVDLRNTIGSNADTAAASATSLTAQIAALQATVTALQATVAAIRHKCQILWGERQNINTGAAVVKGAMAWEGASVNLGEPMAAAGNVIACAVSLGGDVGGAGTAYEVEVYKSTDGGATYNPTGVIAAITGAGGVERSATSGFGTTVAFNAGDLLRMYDKKTGAVAGVDSHASFMVEFA